MQKKYGSIIEKAAFLTLFLFLSGCINPFMEQILGRKENLKAGSSTEEEPDEPDVPGTGDIDAPFLITNPVELQNIGSGTEGWDIDKHYKLTTDITLSASGSNNWTPIGDSGAPFTGSLDGNGKTISNMTINSSGFDYQGMFGYISGNGIDTGIVKNLQLENCSVSGVNNSGAITGYNDGVIQNCAVSGTVSGISMVGGIAGQNSGTIQNCYSEVNSATGNYTGAVTGRNMGTIQYCYTTGNIGNTGSSNFVGGVAGQNTGTIRNCFALNSNISASASFGRITGSNTYSLSGNYGLINMTGNNNPAFSWPGTGLAGIDGSDLEVSAVKSQTVWTNANFDFTNIWKWTDNKMPHLFADDVRDWPSHIQ